MFLPLIPCSGSKTQSILPSPLCLPSPSLLPLSPTPGSSYLQLSRPFPDLSSRWLSTLISHQQLGGRQISWVRHQICNINTKWVIDVSDLWTIWFYYEIVLLMDRILSEYVTFCIILNTSSLPNFVKIRDCCGWFTWPYEPYLIILRSCGHRCLLFCDTRCKYNLNELSHDTAIGLIEKVLAKEVNLKEVRVQIHNSSVTSF